MQKYLYLLCEGEVDEMFYERLAERVTGLSFSIVEEYRYRRGDNWKSVLAHARILLDKLQHWTEKQDVAVIIAVDNDRAPAHPGNLTPDHLLPAKDREKAPRYVELRQLLAKKFGDDPGDWPLDVAVAMPVEMIESWLLLLLEPNRAEPPLFAEADSASAQAHHQGKPPPQLKDLRDAAARARQLTRFDLFWEGADQGDLDQLALRSPSFALFTADLRSWRNGKAE